MLTSLTIFANVSLWLSLFCHFGEQGGPGRAILSNCRFVVKDFDLCVCNVYMPVIVSNLITGWYSVPDNMHNGDEGVFLDAVIEGIRGEPLMCMLCIYRQVLMSTSCDI